MLARDHHFIGGGRAPHLAAQTAQDAQRKDHPLAVNVAGLNGGRAGKQREGGKADRHHRHGQIHLDDEDQ